MGWLAVRGIEWVTGDEKMGSPSGPLLELGDGDHVAVAILLTSSYAFYFGCTYKIVHSR